MKILVLTTSFPTRTAEVFGGGKFVLNDCLAYENAGMEVTVLTPAIQGCPEEETFGHAIRVRRFNYFFPKHWQQIKRPSGDAVYAKKSPLVYLQAPFFLLAYILGILRFARQADVIHANWTTTALLAMPARWLWGTPITLTIRGSDLRLMPGWLNRWICRNVDAILDPYGPYPDNLRTRELFPGPYVTVPAIVVPEPPAPPWPKRPDRFLIVFVCRYDEVKLGMGMGFFVLLEALARVRRNHPQVQAVYVGDGPLRPALEAKARELGVADAVTFVGFQSRVSPFLLSADLVMGGQGLNTVAQEAIWENRVLLMPKVKDWHENLWADRRNILLYETRDADSLADAIEFALLQPQALQGIRQELLAMKTRYVATPETGGPAYLQAFRDAAGQTPQDQEDTAKPPARRKTLWQACKKPVYAIFFILVLGSLAAFVYGKFGELRDYPYQFRWGWLALAAVAATAALGMQFLLWYLLSINFGLNRSLRVAARAWFVSLLGKYLPGKVGPFLVRLELYQDSPKRLVLLASGMEAAISLIAAAGTVLVGLAFPTNLELPAHIRTIMLAGLAVGMIALLPGVLWPLVNTLFRLLRLEPLAERPSYLLLLGLISLSVGGAFVGGLGLFLALSAVQPVAWAAYPTVTGLFYAGAILGMLAFFAPAGLGVREGFLFLTLSALGLPTPVVVVGTLAIRLIATFIEVISSLSVLAFVKPPKRPL